MNRNLIFAFALLVITSCSPGTDEHKPDHFIENGTAFTGYDPVA
jgi:hypothetical protein